MFDGEVQKCDELVSGGSVEVERQDVFHFGCYLCPRQRETFGRGRRVDLFLNLSV